MNRIFSLQFFPPAPHFPQLLGATAGAESHLQAEKNERNIWISFQVEVDKKPVI